MRPSDSSPTQRPRLLRFADDRGGVASRLTALTIRIGCRMRAWLLAVLLLTTLSPSPLGALDEIVLTNGRRYIGTIVTQTPDSVVLAIEGGTVEFPRSAVVSPPFFAPPEASSDSEKPDLPVFDPRQHPLPPLHLALRRLREFSWANDTHQVPVRVTDRGRWKHLPGVSFWVGGFCQLSCYGDPARPAAVEVSLHQPPSDAWDQKRDLLEYMMGLVPGLAVDNRFDSLNIHGDSFAVGDLWFAISPPDSPENSGRWTVRLIHEISVAASRATIQELLAISEPVAETAIDPTKPRSWQRGSWTLEELSWLHRTPVADMAPPESVTDAAAEGPIAAEATSWTLLGGERVFVRSFTRERGSYARSNNDWMRELAANTTP